MELSTFIKPWVSMHDVIEKTTKNQNWDTISDVSLSRTRHARVETSHVDSRVLMSAKLV